MKVSLRWLQDFVKIAPPYEKLAEDLTLAGLEVEKITDVPASADHVFEIEVTTNRPDWLSHLGIAREVAAIRSLPLGQPEMEGGRRVQVPQGWKVEISAREDCPYYTGVLIEGIQQAETPEFMKQRLAACGVRSIDLIVDITNYVLLETGQPLHAFDADLLDGRSLRVRAAKPSEKLILIDGRELTLQKEDRVIADAARALALAGVMGGKLTEVSSRTRNVLLEAAYFQPMRVRQMARRYGLSSDSSYRFERRVDPAGVDLGRQRALWLIQKYAKPDRISSVLRAGEVPADSRKGIRLSHVKIEKILGTVVKPAVVTSHLSRLGFAVSMPSAKTWNVKAPSFRQDVSDEVDLIEEIARLDGFRSIPETIPTRPLTDLNAPVLKESVEIKLRRLLAGAGFFETVTFSMIPNRGLEKINDFKDAVEILNPMQQDVRWMRPTLLPSLMQVVRKNLDHGATGMAFFESAHVYRQPAGAKQPEERGALGIILSGPVRQANWVEKERRVTYQDMKGVVEWLLSALLISGVRFSGIESQLFASGSAEAIYCGQSMCGLLGVVHGEIQKTFDIDDPVYYAEIQLESFEDRMEQIRRFEEPCRFPPVVRDLSISVPESVSAGEIIGLIREWGGGLAVETRVFDLFRGGRIPPGFKNLGLSVTYQAADRTLLAGDIQALHTGIAEKLAQKYHASFQ